MGNFRTISFMQNITLSSLNLLSREDDNCKKLRTKSEETHKLRLKHSNIT